MSAEVRSRRTIAVFAACLLVALGAVFWISSLTLDLLDREKKARTQAALEENVRLALWRMDSEMASLVARESARPYFTYSAFYPAERAYTQMFAGVGEREVLLPSPLVSEDVENVLLHFQVAPSGQLSSPEAPTGRLRALAVEKYVAEERVELAEKRLEELRGMIGGRDVGERLAEAHEKTLSEAGSERLLAQAEAEADKGSQRAQQFSKSSKEWAMRARNIGQASTYSNVNAEPTPKKSGDTSRTKLPPPGAIEEFHEGPLLPLWTHSALVLARRIRVGGAEYVQGAWLDWPKIKTQLLGAIVDLLPNANLMPSEARATQSGALDERRLASLPVRLVPGAILPADAAGADDPETAVKIVLGVAWAGVLLAGAAVMFMLLGTMALSERRAAFVSSVTHELRTPLTTFRMYSEMLAENMVPDEGKRKVYLETLKREAVRLSHLVENVLAYARIERGRQTGRIEDLDVSAVLTRLAERLSDRAAQANMTIEIAGPPPGAGALLTIRADAAAIDQILFNLVDNACKYAQSSTDRRIEIALEPRDRMIGVRVRDHGPGIPRNERRNLFSAFSKSAQRAATSAPGVGLGLALSRRLARTMKGDLVFEPNDQGASFRLDLPRA
jgi:signal transduction histidine kinase